MDRQAAYTAMLKALAARQQDIDELTRRLDGREISEAKLHREIGRRQRRLAAVRRKIEKKHKSRKKRRQSRKR